MLRFLVRRLLGVVVILTVICGVTFYLFFASSGAESVVSLSCGKNCTPDMRTHVRHDLGLDKSLAEQFWIYISGIFTGRDIGAKHCAAPCLGYSFNNNEPVWNTLLDRFPVTLSLTIGAIAMIIFLGVTLGTLAAFYRGKVFDKIAMGTSLVLVSTQIYVLGPFLIWAFVNQLGWLDRPAYHPFTSDIGGWFTGLLLPWFCLMAIFMALYARLTRSTMVDVLNEDFVRTLHAKGLNSRRIYFKHAFRAALSPIITVLGVDVGVLMGGAIITETTFTLHGIGMLAVTSVTDSDLPLMMGVVLVAATFTVMANLVVDLLYAFIDPRVRLD
ncbi:ABC transporter permease [Yinghuangia seranimata]|uniref:ABC transporter permease n=1 Tax=Yinghuangia seranimata TaxID=408067 RepID=UPI00248C09CB|nr:ABC transporter permease [Yinghuangia seranimata]MDI2128915.1 ABC transporter permease [Yinghuangia seranimata]